MTGFLKRNLEASKRLKAKLAARELCTLVNSNHPSPSLVEQLGRCRFDAVLIDAEHGSVSRDRVEDMARAAALTDIAAIIRPEGSVPYLLTGYLGCAVDGFMLPIIRSAEQARELASTFRFSAPSDYASRVLILMIEHIDAVKNLDAILAVEGVDAYMVAPADLALSMGEDLSKARPSSKVDELMDETIARIVKAGKTCGMCVTAETAPRYIRQGATLLYNHADQMLRAGATEYTNVIRAAADSSPVKR